ncbi:MAG: hypothetical protein VKQ33_16450 [Candidatus Sericytochromatia bacterium]|nr:hypothetical protein [Candidatus Sericytochromatia bacterium]
MPVTTPPQAIPQPKPVTVPGAPKADAAPAKTPPTASPPADELKLSPAASAQAPETSPRDNAIAYASLMGLLGTGMGTLLAFARNARYVPGAAIIVGVTALFAAVGAAGGALMDPRKAS